MHRRNGRTKPTMSRSPCPSPALTGPTLPASVEQIIQTICEEQRQKPPDVAVRWQLDQLGEEASLDILRKISTRTITKSLSGYIDFMVKKARGEGTGSLSPSPALTGPTLPASVEQMIQRICEEQRQTRPDTAVRWQLDQLGEEASLDILRKISTRTITKSLSGYIVFMVKKARGEGTGSLSPSNRSAVSTSPSPVGSPIALKQLFVKQILSLWVLLLNNTKTLLWFTSPEKQNKTPPLHPRQNPTPKSSHEPDTVMSSLSPSSSVTGPLLPPSVEQIIQRICAEQCQTPPDAEVRWQLDQLGEEASLDILRKIYTQSVRKSLSADIVFMAKNARSRGTGNLSPSKRSAVSISPCPVGSPNGFSPHSPIAKRALLSPSTNSGTASIGENNPLLALCDLEFRKAFLILSYTGRRKLEELMTIDHIMMQLEELMTVDHIMMLKDLPWRDFETKVWDAVGKNFINKEDRIQYLDWDSRKTHLYHCHVHQDGSYAFKVGPYLGNTRTHLQRELGDDNVLIVKFVEEASECTNKMVGSSYYDAVFNMMAKQGILIGLRRYRFFVFKDGGKEGKKKNQTSSSVKCFFVRFESLAPCEEREPYILANKSVYEARSLFMHANTVSSMAKYMARFSLILSTTVKLQVDLASVTIERIEDTPCRDENGCIVCDEEGEPLIHTDGTGFISEDLALKTPKDFSRAKYIKDGNFERFLDHVNCEEKSPELKGSEAHTREPVRLFRNGLAVKGTLLVNKKLKNTIQIRPSMIKVETDPRLINAQSFNSLEIVAVSHKPKRAFLSKNLIALLSYGGVPKEFFLKILEDELKDPRSAYSDTRAAFRAALNHGGRDDDFTVARMILSGVPLNEPYLQYRLSDLAKDERNALKGGKLPITESFYLIGTTDPTGLLESHQVCVILENGQISGDLLVYRNPGLHFGDIHRLEAVYVKELAEIVGNAKYAIFFSTKGERSIANEIANGDFDGDTYWISRNPELLESFKVSEPWRRIYSTPSVRSKMPNELSMEELEHELFQLFKKTRFQQSNLMGVAADSWAAFMDRLLILGDSCAEETDRMKVTMHQLVDTYYDALDAPKSGKKVVIPDELKAEKFPHYMGRANSYHSTSVLGLIYDTVEKSLQSEDLPAKDVEVSKLPLFDVQLPKDSWMLWGKRYKDYRNEMSAAMKLEDEDAKNVAADAATNNFKQLLYHAPEFEESKRDVEEIYSDALAIYNVVYEYAEKVGDIGKCRFAWKVAGPALVKLYLLKNTETEKVKNPFLCSPTVLQKLFN
ncbi:hypothetical protein RHGRI_008991 [Rhododendron griersonianum]|uniref:RNA-dependent RNA polymerase n=1 Tax=Rhododendron griersonianum TaxID=479676 RepID=A0AAV6L3N6_9ERIC|nr:hypothetical protein RHGRI_008991 [Rhododendron griersonianum]